MAASISAGVCGAKLPFAPYLNIKKEKNLTPYIAGRNQMFSIRVQLSAPIYCIEQTKAIYHHLGRMQQYNILVI